ncbi:MAG: hypothetical protein K9N47_21135 [Prosthecobacter sp.]|uniref:hypothetical protein n=1 Tax=Prosthecobacter sp. TaxID=1965333 RepID=UPI002622E169|nr:hypothetical protein [Prosthecobacter sp.]MCF7788641.1 hypothetical protein [Prosthecobacter sp.]
MFPGDVVCLRCQDRVRAVMTQLLRDYANPDFKAHDIVATRDLQREQITLCAIQQLPKVGRPPKGVPAA